MSRATHPRGLVRQAIARTACVLAVALAGAPAARAAGQLKLIPDDWSVVIALILGFTILIPIVNVLIVRPVLKVVDEREDKVAGARRRADKLEAEANAVLSRYEQAVRETRDECERDRRVHIDAARAQQAEVTSTAREEAEREIAQSRRELQASLDQARTSLRASAQQLARQAAERILGRAVS